MTSSKDIRLGIPLHFPRNSFAHEHAREKGVLNGYVLNGYSGTKHVT